MARYFFGVLLLVAVMASGCATAVYPDGSRHRVPMPQIGVIVTVTNYCSPFVGLYHGAELQAPLVPYGASARIPVSSLAFSGPYRRVHLEVKAFEMGLNPIGSATRTFGVSTYQGSQPELWLVDRLNSPPGARCSPP